MTYLWPQSDVGLGTIIGSAVFNILIIIGATAIVVGEPIQVPYFLTRLILSLTLLPDI